MHHTWMERGISNAEGRFLGRADVATFERRFLAPETLESGSVRAPTVRESDASELPATPSSSVPSSVCGIEMLLTRARPFTVSATESSSDCPIVSLTQQTSSSKPCSCADFSTEAAKSSADPSSVAEAHSPVTCGVNCRSVIVLNMRLWPCGIRVVCVATRNSPVSSMGNEPLELHSCWAAKCVDLPAARASTWWIVQRPVVCPVCVCGVGTAGASGTVVALAAGPASCTMGVEGVLAQEASAVCSRAERDLPFANFLSCFCPEPFLLVPTNETFG